MQYIKRELHKPETFRRKPFEVEGMLWDGTYEMGLDIQEWVKEGGGHTILKDRGHFDYVTLAVVGDNGTTSARSGDAILKDVEGKFYVCPRAVFDKSYEKENTDVQKSESALPDELTYLDDQEAD